MIKLIFRLISTENQMLIIRIDLKNNLVIIIGPEKMELMSYTKDLMSS